MRTKVPLFLIGFALVVLGLYLVFGEKEVDKDPLPQPVKQAASVAASEVEFFRIPVVLHLVQDSGLLSTERTESEVRQLISGAAKIWEQADVNFDVEVTETALPLETRQTILDGDINVLTTLEPFDGKLHVYYIGSLGGINGIALGTGVAVVADNTTVNPWRVTAHEIGHLLGLGHTFESKEHLMYQGVNGEMLTLTEIESVQELLSSSL